MKLKAIFRCGVAAAVSVAAIALPQTAGNAQNSTVTRADNALSVGVNKGTLVRLPQAMSDVFVANQDIADVQVRTDRLLYVYGTGAGETTLYATDSVGRIIYSANVRVAQNIDEIRNMLSLAMPGAAISVDTFNGMTMLSGTVASPEEVEEATRLVQAFVGQKHKIVNKLLTATPQQVNLQVKFAEVSRGLVKELGINFQALGDNFFFSRGRDFLSDTGVISFRPDATSIANIDRYLGLDVAALVEALENDGLVSLLAEPNLTALSGETASFLAGGEFPIAVSDGDGGVTVTFKEYGVGIAFTPVVLSGNRISLRVRPEVSELSEAGAIRLNNIAIPGLVTRRAETTIELGSGQSFMIAGLLRNRLGNTVDKVPLLGELPVLGALFRSTRYQRDESELVIVVTPYLVRPVSSRVALPTDGLAAPNDAERWLMGKTYTKSKQPLPDSHARTTPAPAEAASSSGTVAPGFSND
jgi:pilus assembly protein CpaC